MSSEAKTAANRRNALKSTGPTTGRGRDKSRLNAVKSGIYATTQVLPGEDENARCQLVKSNLEHFAPVGPVENLLVRQITVEEWRLRRIDRADGALGKQVLGDQVNRFIETLDKKAALYVLSQFEPDFNIDELERSPVAANYIATKGNGLFSGAPMTKMTELNAADKKFIDGQIGQIVDVDSLTLDTLVPASERAPQECLDRQRRTTMRFYLAYVTKLMELQEARRTVTLIPSSGEN
jgi:hypothetical protein